MSDYYGEATLEDWLTEEVFGVDAAPVPKDVASLFERWRSGIEADIENWMRSDDGEGNNLSWRQWGRGFNSIADNDEQEFDELIKKGRGIILMINT